MDILLITLGFLLTIIGIVGSFLPVIPGPLTGWFGLLILHLTDAVPMNWWFLGITLAVAILVYVLDYIIPAAGTKRFGGSRFGVVGTVIGLLIGMLFLGPLGIIIGPFAGALVGELIAHQDGDRALKAAFGSFIGFLAGTFMKLIVSLIYVGLFIWKVVSYTPQIFDW